MQQLTEDWLREPLPLFGQLSAEDYAELGLKVGLEIHQQLMTKRKLFCRCPAGCYNNNEHHAEILRHMRPTLSEMGEYDGTALMEFKTRKDIIYLLNQDTVCTYEMDDAPPFEIDDVALDRSLATAMLLGCNIVGEVHITRKQYLDGSIPAGFQRTTIVGTDGDIPFRERVVHIRQISLEEDSCREVSDRGHLRTYRTDRLGMPLIETVTDPDMRTPEEAAAVGQVLRWLTRSSGLVRTGPGAARQDVNVSVTGGTRVEIKGVPSLRAIPRLVHNEALRQRSLVAIQAELQKRGVTADAIPEYSEDITPIVRGTACDFVRRAVEEGATALAIPLPGFAGLLGAHTQPRTNLLKEFSDRIRVVACIDELPNLLISTQEAATLASGEWDRIARACGTDESTPVLVVWGTQRDVETAASEIVLRAREAVAGVPSETRQALDDGTNGFERILPGPDRMYPDTDLPPIRIEDQRLEDIRAALPVPPWQRIRQLREVGVGADLAGRLVRHAALPLFLELVDQCGDGGGPTANTLASLLLDRHCLQAAQMEALDWWRSVLERIGRGELLAESLYRSEEELLAPLAEAEARRRFEQLLAELPADAPAAAEQRELWIMGKVMPELGGRVPGRVVRDWVRREMTDQ